MSRAALASLALLAACATTPPPSVKACPTLATYSQAQQTKAADELDALPADSVVAQMVIDYGALRQEVRACQGAK